MKFYFKILTKSIYFDQGKQEMVYKKATSIFLLISILLISCSLIDNNSIVTEKIDTGLIRHIEQPIVYSAQLQNDFLILESQEQLIKLRDDYKNQIPEAVATVNAFKNYVQPALTEDIPSVATNSSTSPGGTKNDYVSIGTYWWPNPDSPDGLPYVRRDGIRNPAVNDYDRGELSNFRSHLYFLSTLYFVTNEPIYARRGIEYLHSWFVNSETRMNPHMRFAQGIPGNSDGRFIGLIEGREFIYVLDSIFLLKESKYWTTDLDFKISQWYENFYKWYSNSEKGNIADEYVNNHATWYDLQVTAFALAVGKEAEAKHVLDSVLYKRVFTQINDDGSQPHEIQRTKGLQYSALNLQAMVALANLGANYGIDVWESDLYYDSSIIKAIDYVLPFILKQKKWPHQQIDTYNSCSFIPTLHLSYLGTGIEEYEEAVEEIITKFQCEIAY